MGFDQTEVVHRSARCFSRWRHTALLGSCPLAVPAEIAEFVQYRLDELLVPPVWFCGG